MNLTVFICCSAPDHAVAIPFAATQLKTSAFAYRRTVYRTDDGQDCVFSLPRNQFTAAKIGKCLAAKSLAVWTGKGRAFIDDAIQIGIVGAISEGSARITAFAFHSICHKDINLRITAQTIGIYSACSIRIQINIAARSIVDGIILYLCCTFEAQSTVAAFCLYRSTRSGIGGIVVCDHTAI